MPQPLLAPVSEADRAAFVSRMQSAGIKMDAALGASARVIETAPTAQAEAREAAETFRRVVSSGEEVTLLVFDAEGRLVPKSFRVRSPRMGVLMEALAPLLEFALSNPTLTSGTGDAAALGIIQGAALVNHPLRQAVERLVGEVFQQPAGGTFWSDLEWEQAARALEVVADLVPFVRLRAAFQGLAQKAKSGARTLAG